jgi:hypothetical protein
MSNIVNIYYNNKDVFKDVCPTPFVSISQNFIDFKNKWNQVTELTLDGQITGQYLGTNSFYYLNESVKKLLSGFNENYKTISIFENSNNLLSGLAIVNSINFEESPWYGILPFSMNLSIYEPSLFTDYYGVVEPEENISFTEEDGDFISLEHSISAKGIVTENNAIQNAKNWVTQRTGNFNKVTPFLIKDSPFKSYILQSTKETIDRFNGSYSWVGQYRKNINPESPSNAFLNYSIDLSSGIEDGFVQVSINGSLEGNPTNLLRNEYNSLNLFNICSRASEDVFKTQISSRPIAQSVEELKGENKLNFSTTFNNDFESEIIQDYSIDINFDVLKCIANVNFNAKISCKYGDISTKWIKVQDFYKNNFFPYNIVKQEYEKEIQTIKNLNQTPLTESIKFDQFNASIEYSAQYTDKKISLIDGIINLTSNVELTPSINILVTNASINKSREHNIQDLVCANRTRASLNVTATARLDKDLSIAKQAAIDEINRLKSIYIQNTAKQSLEEKTESANIDIRSWTINESWSFQGGIIPAYE